MVIDDALLRHAQRGYPAHVRLDLPHFGGIQHAQAFQTVGAAAVVEIVEARQFFAIHRHHQLAADLVGDAIFLAELHHLPDAVHSQASLYRARFIVETAVQHAAIVAGLMFPDRVFFFEKRDGGAGQTLAETIGGG